MQIVAALTDQLITVGLGFALTTVAGGLLGSFFQWRTWEHQHERTLAEADRLHAIRICGELSQVMDKRLYRMRLLKWAMFAADVDRARIDEVMADYRAVLYEWNDRLHHNLAAAQAQFGTDLRYELENGIYEGFATLGRELETRYRELRRPSAAIGGDAAKDQSETLEQELRALGRRVYALTELMLDQIRRERVGRHAPMPKKAGATQRLRQRS